jgi:putative tryptophan/tyrosine transport system substrate-binding protein
MLDRKRRQFLTLLAGAAAAWPLATFAQQPGLPVMGWMSGRSPEDSTHLLDAFFQGLREAGFVEGQNVSVEYRWARGDYGLLPALAADLVSRRVALLVGVGGDPSAIAAKWATSAIPIVFGMGDDPGGNATGYTLLTNEIESKRISLLKELLPGMPHLGVLLNPNFPPAAAQLQDIEAAVRAVGQAMFVARASNDMELSAALASLVQQGVGAVLVAADPYFDTRRVLIIAFVAQNRLPACTVSRICRRWRSDQLRPEHYGFVSARRHLRWPGSQGRQACRSACPAADEIRAGRQPQDRKGVSRCPTRSSCSPTR